MKNFLKYFSLAFICFFIAFLLGSYTFLKFNNGEKNLIYNNINKSAEKDIKLSEKDKKEKETEKPINSLEEGIERSDRINFILLGMDDIRTDTIIFASFDREYKRVDFISIPRDTYVYGKGYEKAEQRKINAVYGDHGIEGLKKTIEYMLGEVPVHHYVMVDYKGVENIVDSIGGVEVYVPFHMKYEDPTSKPPLCIDIPKGEQVLDGKKAVQFLRYRKGNNNKVGYKEGDLGRIKAQQEFLFSLLNKSLGARLPLVVKSSFEHVNTDISLNEALKYGKEAFGIDKKDFKFSTLPGVASYRTIEGKTLSYYIQDELKTKEIIEELYKVSKKVPME